MTTLHEGDPAPNFTMEGYPHPVTLSDLRGKPVVLYFYPKDDTPGCTIEASGLRDAYPAIREKGAEVLGVSSDSVASHERFAAKHSLPFPLLSDPDHAVAEAYGSWVEKTMYGRTSMGISRDTFLIGPDGSIQRIWRQVKPADHAEAVLSALS